MSDTYRARGFRRLGNRCAWERCVRSMEMPSNEIQEWKQENPYDVDEVPVQPTDLDWAVVLLRYDLAPRPPEHHAHDPEADHHVQRVKTRHHEIQRKEDLGVRRVRGFAELEPDAGYVVFRPFLVVLE